MSRNRFFSNPFSNEERYQRSGATLLDESIGMTKQGALNKTFILTGILVATAILSGMFPSMGLMFFGLIGGLVTALIASFNPQSAPITAPLYAAFEGLFLGTVSIAYAAYAGAEDGSIAYGVIGIAVLCTVGVLVTMLALYRSGVIQPTEKLRAVVFTAIATIGFVYLANMIMHLVGFNGIPYLHTAHPIGILLSLAIIVFAALSLVFDFEIYDKGEAAGAPKYMEWMAGMSLLVTLVWIYLEILRLAAVITANRD